MIKWDKKGGLWGIEGSNQAEIIQFSFCLNYELSTNKLNASCHLISKFTNLSYYSKSKYYQ